jgi:hypothetical protein
MRVCAVTATTGRTASSVAVANSHRGVHCAISVAGVSVCNIAKNKQRDYRYGNYCKHRKNDYIRARKFFLACGIFFLHDKTSVSKNILAIFHINVKASPNCGKIKNTFGRAEHDKRSDYRDNEKTGLVTRTCGSGNARNYERRSITRANERVPYRP